ncbi:MAG: glycosidase [Planctomycetes bacterium]|nr:glycosidase [Planctomycetota bacterium]
MEQGILGDVVVRSPANPLVGINDIPFACSDIWNAGVTCVDGVCIMLITIELLEGRHAIYRARSEDGETFAIDGTPFMVPATEGPRARCESAGIRDPRVTFLEGCYYIGYLAEGDDGLRVALARTKDFQSVEWLGYPTQVDEKNGTLFPARIGGRYALLTRPNAGASIWVIYSDDLEFWGSPAPVMTPRAGYWDSDRIGPGPPPIETEQGWLLLYYGQKSTSAGPLVRLGAALLDREDPARVLARSNIPILSPRERYERIGDVPNVVFSCGALLSDGIVTVYYGASDSVICRGSAPLEEIIGHCFRSAREF